MCETCGCSDTQHHGHHDHGHGEIDLGRQSLLSMNDRLAAGNRRLFQEKGITVINIVSSPGSGKTALLERTLQDLGRELKMAVIVGDLATDRDAVRLRATGAPAVQISTGTACHLDAHMVHHAVDELNLDGIDLLFIENVGNLVCPASFDLGEDLSVVLHSTTEGEDKPLKYPVIFLKADCVIVNKTDLSRAVNFNREQAMENIIAAAPKAKIFELSAKTGDGTTPWYEFLRSLVAARKRIHA